MLSRILPSGVAVATTRAELVEETLFVEETRSVERAVEKRRREFLTGRACARKALEELGLPAQAVPVGPRGEPRWPSGVVGSLTHCDGFRGCALAPAERFAAIGVDAEPNRPLPHALLPDIASEVERAWVEDYAREAPEVCWDRLVFSAKESVYKAWFPLAGCWLGFEDAVVELDREAGEFRCRLLVPGPRLGSEELRAFSGRWLVADGLIVTAVTVPAARAPAAEGGFGLRVVRGGA